MALLDLNLTPAAPSTHAFVVGVGTYPFLTGGSSPHRRDEWGLGQLSSPPFSALRFIRWLLEDFHNKDAPLSTIEHLISSPHQVADRKGVAHPSEEPEFRNIAKAYTRWIKRAGSDPRNIALFYFVGHGVAKGDETALLAADFGDPDLANLTANAIHLEETLKGMFACKADRQVFFIDACRTKDPILDQSLNRPGEPLGTATNHDTRQIPQPAICATALTQKALGQGGGVSLFTECLIEALNGMAADDTQGGFQAGDCFVSTDRLPSAIQSALAIKLLSKPWLGTAECRAIRGGSVDLHFPKEPIQVPLIMTCAPDLLNGSANMEIKRKDTVLETRDPEEEFWLTWHPPDRYDLTSSLAGGGSITKGVLLTPPYKRVVFEFSDPAPPV